MPPQRKSALTAEEQVGKRNLPPKNKKQASAWSQGAIPSHPQSLHLLLETLPSKAAGYLSTPSTLKLYSTRSSSWPLSKLQNTLGKAYFKAVIPWLTVLLEFSKDVKEKDTEQEAFSLPSGELKAAPPSSSTDNYLPGKKLPHHQGSPLKQVQ